MSDLPADSDRATLLYRHRTDTVSVDRGDGPPIVFAHGTLMDRTMFDAQVAALSDAYRAIAYDLRARTDQWGGPYDLDDLADDWRTFVDAKGLDSCVLAGMSMGGFTALRAALRYPDAVDGLVLIDSMAAPHDESEREQYGEMIETARREGDLPEPMADIVSNMLFGQTSIEERTDLVDHWKQRWLTYPGEAVYHEVGSWLDREDVTDRLSEIDVPVLIVHGEEDISIEPERAEPMLAELPDARMETIPAAGHSSNVENPEPVNDAIREFLEEVY